MNNIKKIFILPLVIFALLPFFNGISQASTNPDTPTPLKGNILLGFLKKEGNFPTQYFSFKAGPGTVKLRVTIRPYTDGSTVNAELRDLNGNSLVRAGGGTSNNHDLTDTKTITLNSEQTLLLAISGSGTFYGQHHPTFRIQLDGAVQLDKKTAPFKLILK
jgi:uncharacterized protein YgbK (DUF1537 family)